jgi:BASS family bile acid:Na+ symporter
MAAKLTKRADMALAISLTVVLQLVNIVVAPLWAQAVVSGATVSPGVIIKDMCFLVLIPLAVGIFLRARYKDDTASWKTECERISNMALVLLFAFGLAANWKLVVNQIGSWVIIVSIILTLVPAALGALIGLRDRPTALSGAMVTGMRFVPIGLIVISTQLHNNPAYLAPALVYGVVYTFVMLGLGAELGHIGGGRKAAPDRSVHGTSRPSGR